MGIFCKKKNKRSKEFEIFRISSDMLSQSRIIAKGKRIRDLERLIKQYGGKPSEWSKKSSPTFEIAGLFYEYHWYENPDIGRVEFKRKQVL